MPQFLLKRAWIGAILAILPASLFALPAYAANANEIFSKAIVPCNGIDCKLCDIATVAQNVLNAGIFVAVFLSAILFAYAGGKLLTSVANPHGMQSAKEMFRNVLVGLLIILAAWLIVDVLMRTLMGASYLPWNKIC